MKRLILAALVVAGCGGNGAGSDGGAGGGGSGGGNGNATSLVGTWDLLSGMGGPSQGTLVLTQSHLTVTTGGDVLDLQVDGTPAFAWSEHGQAAAISTTHANAGGSYGIVPLAIDGDWTFTGAHGGSCNASLQPGSMIGSCAGAGYSPFPPGLNHHATATRTAQLGSVFGDLGGTWTVSDEKGESCTATIQGATIMASCKSGGTSTFGISITFGDGVASGSLDSGGEFSARRR